MHTENAYFSGKMAEKKQQKCWDAFCQTGSVADYLQYRASCERAEGNANGGNTFDGQGAGHTGNTVS